MYAVNKMAKVARTTLGLGAAALAALTLTAARPAGACDECESKFKPGTYTGDAKRLGNGVAYSWVTLNEKGKPAAIGVTFTETTLDGLPELGPNGMAWHGFNLMLPKEAMKTAFDHIGVDWNPKGHEPNGIYNVAHFDLHFYTISEATRMKITATGADLARCSKPLAAGFMPQGYVIAPKTEVPMMGAHMVDPKAPELNGKPFTYTFIYGAYDGKLAFFEPMLTKTWIETKPNFSQDIALPKSYDKSAFYPTRYTVRYDAARREYTVALEGMVWREGADKGKSIVAKPGAARPAAKPAKAAAGKVAARR